MDRSTLPLKSLCICVGLVILAGYAVFLFV